MGTMNMMNGDEIAREYEREQTRAELEQERADELADAIEERAAQIAKQLLAEDTDLAVQARREALEDASLIEWANLDMLHDLVWGFDDPRVQREALRYREAVLEVAAESPLIMDEARKRAAKELGAAEKGIT